MKVCKKCDKSLPHKCFRKHDFNRDGLTGKCKDCLHEDRVIRESKRIAKSIEFKTCYCCKNSMRSFNFVKNKSTKDGLNGWCRRCTKDSVLRKRYSISIDDYELMLSQQQNSCAICSTNNPGGPKLDFVVDHCHRTGVVRGLLCNHCNTGLGKLGDTIESLTSALNYLKANKELSEQ